MTSLPEATAPTPRTTDAAAPTTPLPLPGRGGPLSARRARTRQRLMAAAVQVFAERGVIGSSVEEICEAAGFTRIALRATDAAGRTAPSSYVRRGDEAVVGVKAGGK